MYVIGGGGERGARQAYHAGGGDGGEGNLLVAGVVLGQQICGESPIHPSNAQIKRVKKC
jgi:hypothetical protein